MPRTDIVSKDKGHVFEQISELNSIAVVRTGLMVRSKRPENASIARLKSQLLFR